MSRIRPVAIAGAVGAMLLVACMAAGWTIAQQATEPRASAPAKRQTLPTSPLPSAAQVAASGTPTQPLPVSLEQALYLIRSTLITLNDANRSGNYTVLRDLAAPDFQARNTSADLAQAFSDLRRRNFDLYSVALLAPQLAAAPALDAEKRLHLVGFFPTRPQQINFDLLFEVVGAQWRLFGIAIATPDAAMQPPSANAASATLPKSK